VFGVVDIKYRIAHPDMAIELLRPGAKYRAQVKSSDGQEEIEFAEWDDERPQPSSAEIFSIVSSMRAIEESINIIYTDEQKKILDSVVVSLEE
jgi:hypothetical protein